MEMEPGTLINDRYVVEAEIGRGGMAIVYRVRHAQLGTLAALKLLTMPATSVQKRLMHEGRVQAALQHPNIVTVSDVVVHNNAPGLVMEYVRGPSLDDFLLQRRPTLAQADLIVTGILEGVGAAHQHGLIHRDLKPANIMLAITDSGLIPKVTDFGLVKVLEGDTSMSKTRSGVAMGTPSYMAPEQISDAKSVDVRADIFSLGAILYEVLSSQRTFDHEDMFQVFSAIVTGTYKPIRELVPDVPERMERAIQGALTPDRDQRIPDVRTLLAVWRGEQDLEGNVIADAVTLNPWGREFLDDISSLGAGGESTAESLKRSLQGDLPTQNRRSEEDDGRPRPERPGQKTQGTMAPIPGMFDHLEAQAQAPHPESPRQAAPAGEVPSPLTAKTTGLIVALGSLGFVVVVVGTVGLAWYLRKDTPPVVPEPTALVIQTPPPAPVEPTPSPVVPVEPAPTEPGPTNAPVPVAPVPVPVAPVPVAPAPVAPVPVAPTPVAPVPATPEPAAPVPVAPVPVAAEPQELPPFVGINGGGATVSLLTPQGTPVPPENLKPGTYRIVAFFESGVPTEIQTITVKNGDQYNVRCSKSLGKCAVTQR